MLSQSIILGSLAAIASAATLNVQVSDNNATLVFTPATTKASVGDTVTFHFYPKNHDVVQGSLAAPCAPLAGGFFSGFIPSTAGEANKTFSVTVKDDKPIWFYCSQGKHCNAGMAGVINPPSGSTIADYIKAASNATVVTPTVVIGTGGTFGAPGSASSSSGSAASSTSGSTASSTSKAASSSASATGSATGSAAASAASASATAKSGAEMFQVPGAFALAAGFVALL